VQIHVKEPTIKRTGSAAGAPCRARCLGVPKHQRAGWPAAGGDFFLGRFFTMWVHRFFIRWNWRTQAEISGRSCCPGGSGH